MKDIKILISSILIICAFFLGYVFANKSHQYKTNENTNNKIYINIENKGKNIQIDSENPDVVLLLNGQETLSGSIMIK